jgi:3-deoxy-D-manno-octulosonate 8-phosphate phosphatase (KDO 8-P phosphatase)
MKADDIKILFMDVDGTLTDGKIYFGPDGECLKAFNVKDGYAITRLRHYGVIPVIITGRSSVIVEKRAADLKVEEIYQGVDNKLEVLELVQQKHRVKPEQCAYIGDDLNDIEAMKTCGYAACPADAADEVKEICSYVARKRAGDGAVREIIDQILKTLF